jgi:hypothetical protein
MGQAEVRNDGKKGRLGDYKRRRDEGTKRRDNKPCKSVYTVKKKINSDILI